jgi:hypothetical protein
MGAITATNSATPSLSAMLGRARLEQARREADQAEATAQELRAQADNQDRVVTQKQQQIHTLEVSASAPSAVTPDSSAPPPDKPKTAAQTNPTYAETLGSVFQAAKPLVSAKYTYATQKNIVTSSVFQAASNLWSASPTQSRAIQQYGSQSNKTPSPSAGSVLNAVA